MDIILFYLYKKGLTSYNRLGILLPTTVRRKQSFAIIKDKIILNYYLIGDKWLVCQMGSCVISTHLEKRNT